MLRFKTFITEGLVKEELTPEQKEGFNRMAHTVAGYPILKDISGNVLASTKAINLSKHVIPEGQDSIEIPAKNSIVSDIHEHLKNHNYHEIDYANKTAYKTVALRDGSTKKVGKSIGSILQATKAPQDLINRFVNDNHKESADFSNKYKIIISRNPHHIAECSTNKSWSSCATLDSTGNPTWTSPTLAGHKLPTEIYRGSHVAYLVNNEDKPHQELIDNATSRIMLKPFSSKSGHTVLVPENKSYIKDYKDGITAPSGFLNTLKSFANKHFPLESNIFYRKHPDLYNDDGIEHKINITNLNTPISNTDPEVLKNTIESANISKEQIDNFLDNVSENHPNRHLLSYLPSNKNFDNNHIGKLFTSGKISVVPHPGLAKLTEKRLSSEHIHSFLDHIINDTDIDDYDGSKLGKRLVQQKTFNNTHVDKVINNLKPNDHYSNIHGLVTGITSNENVTLAPKHIDKLLALKDKLISYNLGKHKNINSNHIDKLIDHESNDIDGLLSTHKNLSEDNISTLLSRHLNNGSDYTKDNLLWRPDLTHNHVSYILSKSQDLDHIKTLLNNEYISDDTISKVIDKNHEFTNILISKFKPSLNSNHIHKLLDQYLHKSDYESNLIVKNITANEENELNSLHIDRILSSIHNTPSNRRYLIHDQYDRLNSDHITKILEKNDESDRNDLVGHPNLTANHIQTYYKN